MYNVFLEKLILLQDNIFQKKEAYIAYFASIQRALSELDTEKLVERWAEVDTLWMDIDTPVQPGHPI